MKNIFNYWLSPNIPKEYQKPNLKELGYFGMVRAILVHWTIHPIKRRLAKYYCLILQKIFNLKVIGITGSAGKSTTKEMLASILKVKSKTVYSFSNIDPIYNIPTTILKCTPFTKYLILEMGVEYPNEMDFYLWMVKPKICVITSIYSTHTEFFKNTQGVYKEKIKLANEVVKKGKVILNNEDNFLKNYKEYPNQTIFYGSGTNYEAGEIKYSLSGTSYVFNNGINKITFNLPTVGKSNVVNSLAAIAVAKTLGIEDNFIKRGLESFKPLEHRLDVFKFKDAIVIDDTYNSNPVAMDSALDVLDTLSKGRKIIAVIGDMLELGESSHKFHIELAKNIEKRSINYLICVGQESKTLFDYFNNQAKIKCYWVEKQDMVDKILKTLIDKNSIILLKASHSIELYKVVDRLFK